MINDLEIKEKARKLLENSNLSEDGINLDEYKFELIDKVTYSNESEIPADLRASMDSVGIDLDEQNSGLYLQSGNSPDLCVSKVQGIEFLPIHNSRLYCPLCHIRQKCPHKARRLCYPGILDESNPGFPYLQTWRNQLYNHYL